MDIEKDDYHQKNDLLCFSIMIFHLFVCILLFIYVLTSLWYLQELWSINDDRHYQMSLITKKFTYSIRSLLLLTYLQ